jgi:tellurite resistance protein TerC
VPHIKRIIVTVVGGTVLILGAALIFLPGQVVVILAGLAILGTEYAWARLWLRKGRQLASRALSQTQRMVSRRADLSGKGAVTGSPEPASVVANVKDDAP